MRPSLTILSTALSAAALLSLPSAPTTLAYTFLPSTPTTTHRRTPSSSSSLQMVDAQTLQVGAISVAGLATGIGLLAFTDKQALNSNERTGGLSDSQTNKIIGGLVVEEVEDGKDAGSLASQLENALKQSGTLSQEVEEEILDNVGKDYDGGDGW